MAFQAVDKTAKVFIQFLSNGELWGNTYYFWKADGYDQDDLDDLAADMDDWVAVELLPNLSAECVYVGTYVTGLEHQEDYTAYSDASGGAGGQAGVCLPNNAVLCMKRISEFTGRSARGRVYIGGLRSTNLTSGASNQNTWSATTISTVLAALLEIATYVVTHGWIEVIVSRWNEGVKRADGQTRSVVDWTFTDDVVDSQRGRLH